MNKLHVIGIGYRPLDKKAREIIYNSAVILTSNRLFEVFKGYEEFEDVKDKIKVINNVDETINFIRTQTQHSELLTQNSKFKTMVFLASGDPMFFGIGRRTVKEFGKDRVEIIPDLSSVQMAFATIKEPWDDAFLMSLHGGPDPEKRRRSPYEINDMPSLLQRHYKIAILTDKENNPSEIAKIIISNLKSQISNLIMHVCEKLGYPDERITAGTPEEIAGMSFEDPNVVIIKSTAIEHRGDVRVGLSEDEIIHSKGLITKDEVRAVNIHKLRLPQRGVFWDIGAGSGSISIEAARLCPELRVYAVERDEEQIRNIRENQNRFRVDNIEIIKGEAPDILINLLPPDRVFIGGSGGRLKDIVDNISTKMSDGIVVINSTTIETLNEAIQLLEDNGFKVEISEVSISRSKIIAGRRHMSALNPVFIIKGEKF